MTGKATATRGNLPAELTSFIGRRRQLQDVKSALTGARLVTLVGPGVSPGTFRSTPWGMLMRVVPEKAVSLNVIKPVGTADAPVCTL